MDINTAKMGFLTVIGMAGGIASSLLGGWDNGLQALLMFMAADYLTGLAIALVWKRSPKTESGAASSNAGLKGLFKKGGMLLLVLIAVRLDLLMGTDYLRNGVIIALVANELISLTENLGLMGVPVPAPIMKAIDLLKTKEENENV